LLPAGAGSLYSGKPTEGQNLKDPRLPETGITEQPDLPKEAAPLFSSASDQATSVFPAIAAQPEDEILPHVRRVRGPPEAPLQEPVQKSKQRLTAPPLKRKRSGSEVAGDDREDTHPRYCRIYLGCHYLLCVNSLHRSGQTQSIGDRNFTDITLAARLFCPAGVLHLAI
jgi:hypothetical protein